MLRSLLLIPFRMAIGFHLPVTQPRVFWAIICQLLGILTLLFMQFQSFWTIAVLRNIVSLLFALTLWQLRRARSFAWWSILDMLIVTSFVLSLSTRTFARCHRFFKKDTGSLLGTSNLDTTMLVFWAWFGIFWAWFGLFIITLMIHLWQRNTMDLQYKRWYKNYYKNDFQTSRFHLEMINTDINIDN